jgi:hypothetical protein
MKDHTDLLNHIAAKIGAQTYVEIGVFNPDHNFNKIKIAHKIGIDPEVKAGADLKWTSDKFWEFARASKMKVDLSWIDGLHYEEQVIRDILGAWEITRPGGVIAIHDTNPPTEATTCIPRGAQREWCGDVYKAISRLTFPEPITADFDYGVTLIRKLWGSQDLTFVKLAEFSWEEFSRNRKAFLNLKPLEEVIAIVNNWE